MPSNFLFQKAKTYLKKLCLEIPTRRVGTKGNQTATDFFASMVSSFGFETQSPVFYCIDWIQEGVDLSVEDIHFKALVSPYSLGGHVKAPLIIVSTVEELTAAKISDKIVLLRGDITREQLRKSKPLPRIPFVIMTVADRAKAMGPMFSDEALEKMAEMDLALNKKLAALIPGGSLIIVEETGHNIHVDKPEVLIAPVVEMIKELREKKEN